MMEINSNTKLNSLFKYHKGALDTIISLNEKFEKLKNPLLRKIMAPRTTISMAAKIGGCRTNDFFEALRPLGFTVSDDPDGLKKVSPGPDAKIPTVSAKNILDVRPLLSGGKDPLKDILNMASRLTEGEWMYIINSFEPVPLVALLHKQGFNARTFQKSEMEYHSYFTRISPSSPMKMSAVLDKGWSESIAQYRDRCNFVDVREMTPPLPMVTILEAMELLPEGFALYVYHKRVPLYLFPEIDDRGFEYRLTEVKKDEVHLLIFRK